MGQVDDVAHCVTMDLKEPGNLLYLVGVTHDELGGSHFALVDDLDGGQVPEVDPAERQGDLRRGAPGDRRAALVARVPRPERRRAGRRRWPKWRSPAALAPRSLASDMPLESDELSLAAMLFSESNTRFLCEVPQDRARVFEEVLTGIPFGKIGVVTDGNRVTIRAHESGHLAIDQGIAELREAWQSPLRW